MISENVTAKKTAQNNKQPKKARPGKKAWQSNGKPKPKFAYMMSRFPKISETFVLYEILAIMEMGLQVEVYPLLKEHQKVVHSGVKKVQPFVHYHGYFSGGILWSNVYFLLTAPFKYISLLIYLITGSIKSPQHFSKTIILFPKIVRIAHKMRKQGIDHIHAHFATFPAAAAMIIKRLTGIPYSFTAHGSDIHVYKHRFRMRDKVINSDFVRSISNYNKNIIINASGSDVEDKIKVIHCGIDPEVFSSTPEKKIDQPLNFITIASYEEVKGHKYLIEACKKLADDKIDFHLHLIGDGPLRNTVAEQIKSLGLSEKITIHGSMPREEVAKKLQTSDIKILPSILTKRGDREGIPVAIMEAMAMGLPVISSKLSGIPELVGHDTTGILVTPQDSIGIYQALKKLSTDPDLRVEMGKAGQKKVFKEFDLNDNSAQLLDLLMSQVNKSQSRK